MGERHNCERGIEGDEPAGLADAAIEGAALAVGEREVGAGEGDLFGVEMPIGVEVGAGGDRFYRHRGDRGEFTAPVIIDGDHAAVGALRSEEFGLSGEIFAHIGVVVEVVL